MSKSSKKKPAGAPGAADAAKAQSSVISALHPAIKGAADAGRPSAKTGGKSASANKGR
jgi:hypothetical protein